MKSEAAVWVGVIMAILTLFNIVLTPEDAEAVQVIVEFVILSGGIAAIRHFVASRLSVKTQAGVEAERKVFGNVK